MHQQIEEASFLIRRNYPCKKNLNFIYYKIIFVKQRPFVIVFAKEGFGDCKISNFYLNDCLVSAFFLNLT